MAANLGLVAHAAQRKPHELAPRGLGDRHAQRSFAHARRPDEAQDRSLGILHQLPHGEKLQDALLDLFQAVVVGVQNLFREVDGARFLRPLLPRHRQQPVDVVAAHGGLGRHGRHGFELFQLLDALVEHVLGHARGLDLLAQLVELALLAAAQLFLDGLDLFVEVILFLRALHLPLHARLDVAVQIELLNLHIEHVGEARQPRRRIEDGQQLLLLLDAHLQIRGNGVGELGRLVHAHGGDDGFVVQRLLQLDVIFKQRRHALHQLLGRGRHLEVALAGAHRGHKEAVAVGDFKRLGALHAFHQHLDVAVGHLHALHDVADGPDLEDVLGLGLVDRGVVLRGEKDLAVAGERLFERAHARLPAHHERGHHVGKDDHVADGHHGQLARFVFFAGHSHRFVSISYTRGRRRKSPTDARSLWDCTAEVNRRRMKRRTNRSA